MSYLNSTDRTVDEYRRLARRTDKLRDRSRHSVTRASSGAAEKLARVLAELRRAPKVPDVRHH
jgi:hypothetical protein